MNKWELIKLGKLLTESKIESVKPDTNRRIRVKLNTGGVEKRPDANDKQGATKYYTRKAGQFIYGKQNLHKGAFGIVPPELDGYESSSDIPAFDVSDLCYPKWIYYFFKQGNFYLKLESLAKGVGSKRIQQSQLYDLNITLPPKQEQKRILDSVEDFEQKYIKLNNEINYQRNLVLKLKLKTLQDAIEGKLTVDWRKIHNKRYDAEIFLKEIKKENLNLASKIYKEKKAPKINLDELPFQAPDKWIWFRLGDLIKEKPRNGYSPQAVNYVTKIKSLKLGATTRGVFDPKEFKYLDIEVPDNSYLWLESGDILIQRSNSLDYVGVSAIYKGKSKEFIYPDLMMKFRGLNCIENEYLQRILSSEYVRNYFRSNATGTSGTMPKINQSVVVNTLICLPSKDEQKQILKKLDYLYDFYSSLETLVDEKKNNLNKLYQKTLNDIFGNKNNEISKIKNEKSGISMLDLKSISNYTLKNNSNMELEQLLKQNGKMSAISLWKISKFENDIDAFYEELKRLVEVEKTVMESNEKGFLELSKNEN